MYIVKQYNDKDTINIKNDIILGSFETWEEADNFISENGFHAYVCIE